MTGEHPRDTGIVDNGHALLSTARTLADVFAEAGWATWAVTSAAHLRPAVSGLGQGFERFARTSEVQRRAGEAVDQALSWLDEGGSRPVFLWLHLFDAHMPYEVPAPFDRLGYDGPHDPYDPALPDPGLSRELPGNLAGLRVLDFGRKQYAAQIAYLDHELGRLLERPEVVAGTVALVGDHGEVLGAHDIWFDHAELYTDTLHVPLVLAWPGAPAGSRRDDPVSHLDLGRTLLDLAGLEQAAFPGRGLTSAPLPGPLFALASHRTSVSITHEQAHLVLHLVSHNRRYEAHQVELFDLSDDPGCERDLVGERVALAGRLRARLIEWLGARRELGWSGHESTDLEVLGQLRELGYVEAPQAGPGAVLFEQDECGWCSRWR
jgi:arylsulfatase A-like enzyme